jgi:DNA-binding transcriptional ArsR family regulator
VADHPPPLDPRLIKAISHPLRHRLLVLLNEREASPKQLADEVGESLGSVSHHVRVLAAIGAITLVRTAPRRGAVEHFYRATVHPRLADARGAATPRRAAEDAYLQRVGDLAATVESGAFDRVKAHVSYTLLDLDERTMNRVAEILETALERILAVNAESEQRLADGPAAMRAELAMLLFERPR